MSEVPAGNENENGTENETPETQNETPSEPTAPALVPFPADLQPEGDLPEGVKLVDDTVKVGKYTFAVRYPQFENRAAVDAHAARVAAESDEVGTDADSIVVSWINRLQATGAKGGTTAVAKADNDTDRAEAIAGKQKNALSYFLGIMRGGRKAAGGFTEKKKAEFGERVMAIVKTKGQISQKKLAEIAAEMGIDLAALQAED